MAHGLQHCCTPVSRRSIGPMDSGNAPIVPPPVVAAAAIAAQYLIKRDRSASCTRMAIAAVLGISSAALALWAEVGFHKAGTTVNPLQPTKSSRLVVIGAHAVSRNPMYLGMVVGVAAHGIYRGAFTTQVPTLGLWLWLDQWQIRAEETALEAKFGDQYRQYLAGVRRWLGRKQQ